VIHRAGSTGGDLTVSVPGIARLACRSIVAPGDPGSSFCGCSGSSLGDEPRHEPPPDRPGGAGDEDAHQTGTMIGSPGTPTMTATQRVQ